MTRALSVLLALTLACAPAIARGQANVPLRPMTVAWSGQLPRLTFSTREFLTPELAKKLQSGLPQRIETRVYAYREDTASPITAAVTSCRVVYDLWQGGFRVERSTEAQDKSYSVPTLARVAELCLEVSRLPLGDPRAFEGLRGRPIYFATIVELNPLSADTVRRIRRWLSRSGGGEIEGDAFFGSFVSIFVSRRMGSAERTLTFRSRTLSVPP